MNMKRWPCSGETVSLHFICVAKEELPISECDKITFTFPPIFYIGSESKLQISMDRHRSWQEAQSYLDY